MGVGQRYPQSLRKGRLKSNLRARDGGKREYRRGNVYPACTGVGQRSLPIYTRDLLRVMSSLIFHDRLFEGTKSERGTARAAHYDFAAQLIDNDFLLQSLDIGKRRALHPFSH